MVEIKLLGNGTVKIVYPVDESKSKIKITVEKDGVTYTYTHKFDSIIIPLQMGKGEYIIKIWKHKTGNTYSLIYTTAVNEKSDELAVFLNPNIIVNYSAESICVRRAKMIADKYPAQSDKIKYIAECIKFKLEYDYEEAKIFKDSGGVGEHLCTVDSIYSSGKGICSDYSLVFAAMLRSQGIPCKMVYGRVSKGTMYHAWNEVYINGKCKLMDLTFSDNGVTNYTDYTPEKYY